MSIKAPEADAWTSPSMMLWKTFFSDMLTLRRTRSRPRAHNLGRPGAPVDSPARPACSGLFGLGATCGIVQTDIAESVPTDAGVADGEASARTARRGGVPPDRSGPPPRQVPDRGVAVRLHRAPGTTQGGGEGLALRRPGAAYGARRALEPRGQPDLGGRRRPDRRRGRVLDAHSRRHAALHRGRVPRGRRGDAGPPRRDRGPGGARHHRHVAGGHRGVDLRQGADAGAVARPSARLVRHLVPRDPRGQPLRPPGVRAQGGRRRQHPGAPRDRERPRPRPARGRRGVRARRVDRRAAHRPRPAAHHPARRRLVHPRRHRAASGRTGRCGWASTTARVRSSTRWPTTTTGPSARSPTGCRSPRWSSPTAMPRSTTTGVPPSTSASGASAS